MLSGVDQLRTSYRGDGEKRFVLKHLEAMLAETKILSTIILTKNQMYLIYFEMAITEEIIFQCSNEESAASLLRLKKYVFC